MKNQEAKGYEKYRWFYTSSGKLVIGGKNAGQNEEIMMQVRKEDVIMHTASPGSPFCIVKSPDKEDIEEVAEFTAGFSQDWKRGKKKSEIHIFKGEQVVKKKNMSTGTFGIMGNPEKKTVELKLGLDFQEGKLRAIPLGAAKKNIITLVPGEMSKEQAAEKIAEIIRTKIFYPIKIDEVMSAIPSDKIGIVEHKTK